jgi:hypothetical protein
MRLHESIQILLTMSFVACQSNTPKVTVANMVAGEWAIQLSDAPLNPSHRDEPGASVRGVVVLHPAIKCYCSEDSRPPAGAIFGRGYIALGRLLNPTASREQPTFAFPDWGGDMGEEVMVTTGPQGRVDLYLAPQYSGPHFIGTLYVDSIKGRWLARGSGNRQQSGTFLMRRIPRSFYTDSALRRASRGVKSWRIATPPLITSPADTVHPLGSRK